MRLDANSLRQFMQRAQNTYGPKKTVDISRIVTHGPHHFGKIGHGLRLSIWLLLHLGNSSNSNKVPYNRKVRGHRPKSHVILTGIYNLASYQKKNSESPWEKTAKIWINPIYITFGPITSRYSVKWDFKTGHGKLRDLQKKALKQETTIWSI